VNRLAEIAREQSVADAVTATLARHSSSQPLSQPPVSSSEPQFPIQRPTPIPCSRTLNIATAASAPAGTHNITVTGTGGAVTKTTNRPDRQCASWESPPINVNAVQFSKTQQHGERNSSVLASGVQSCLGFKEQKCATKELFTSGHVK
jgi:hypothetical protein